MNNFVTLPSELVNSYWGKFIALIRDVPHHRIDDESLKEYFYKGQDENKKEVLDTTANGSDGECTYSEIAEKLDNISCINKSWSTKKSDTRKNTFVVKATKNLDADEIRELTAQMKTELSLVLMHVRGGTKMVTGGELFNLNSTIGRRVLP